MSEAGGAWIGEAPKRLEAGATFYAGIAALMVGGVQPQVLGALVDAGRIGLADIGRVATLESLGMALGASLGPLLLRRFGTRALGFAGAVLAAAGNFASPLAHTLAPLLALRGAIGVAEGALLSLTIALIARAPAPERWSGTFLGVQTLSQSVGAWALPRLFAPALGVNGGFVLLGATSLLACGLAPFAARDSASSGPSGDAHGGRLPLVGWLGLAFVLAMLAGSGAIWSYFERIGDSHGLDSAFIGTAAAANLVAQAVGSFAATGVGPRLRWLAALAISGLAQIGAIHALGAASGAASYALAGVVFGFFWLFGMPYQVRALVELDPTRTSARWIASAQILGGSLGPLAASALVRGEGLGGVLGFGMGATAAALALAVVANAVGRKNPA